jgi:tetratricopeptide (TPR) repeat protein
MNSLRKQTGNAKPAFAIRPIANSPGHKRFGPGTNFWMMRFINKASLIILALVPVATFPVVAEQATSAKLQKYVSTARPFELPDSFETTNEAQCRLLVEANPSRFEARLVLAMALSRTGKIEEALDEFKRVDELASQEHDRDILAGLPYDDVYAFALVIAADRRFKKRVDDLLALRMLQQAIGMDTSKLSEMRRLSQCYMMLSALYLKRGLYDQAIESATKGIEIAKKEDHADFIPIFDETRTKAKEFQRQWTAKQSERGKKP